MVSELTWEEDTMQLRELGLPICNVPDPPADEEDATMSLTIWENRHMNMNIGKN